jgi:hypothetical protein
MEDQGVGLASNGVTSVRNFMKISQVVEMGGNRHKQHGDLKPTFFPEDRKVGQI